MKSLMCFVLGLIGFSLFCQSCDKDKKEVAGIITFSTNLAIDTVRSAADGSKAQALLNELYNKELIQDVAKKVNNSWSFVFEGMDSLSNIIDSQFPICIQTGRDAVTLLKKKKEIFDAKVAADDYGPGSFKVKAYLLYGYADYVVSSDSVVFVYPLETK